MSVHIINSGHCQYNAIPTQFGVNHLGKCKVYMFPSHNYDFEVDQSCIGLH